MSASPVPPDRSQEIIDRLDVLERKIDWIVKRILLSPGAPPQATPQPTPATSRPEPQQVPLRQFPVPSHGAGPHVRPAATQPAATQPAATQPAASPAARQPGPSAVPTHPAAPVRPTGPAPVSGALPQPANPNRQPALRLARVGTEGNLGRYLLSGAAALLVVLAAVSLIALVWDSIPDVLKAGVPGLAAVTFVGTGTWLAKNRPIQRVAAATMTGTGGALGFVSIIGAVLLGNIVPTLAAFVLMVLWSLVLLALSRLTMQVFTAVVSTIGALVTIGFASWQILTEPASAVSTWTMVCGYVTALAVVAGVLARDTSSMRLAAWYPTTSMVVTGAAMTVAPTGILVAASVPMAIVLILVPAAVLLVQLVHSSRALWVAGSRSLTGLDWAVAGTILGVSVSRLLWVISTFGDPGGAEGLRLTVVVLLLVLVTGPTVALLAAPGPEGWRRRAAPVHLGVVAVLGLASLRQDRLTFVVAVLAVALAVAVSVMEGLAPALAVLPAFGLLSFACYSEATPALLAGIVGVLLAVGLTVVLEPVLESRTTAVPRGRVGLQAQRSAEQAATWLVAANLVVAVPTLLHRLLPGGEPARAVVTLLGGGMVLVLLLLGLVHPTVSPRRLLTGTLAGRLPGDDTQTPDGEPPASVWLGWALAGTAALVVMVNADLLSSILWRVLLMALALGLGVLAARMLQPWIRTTQGALGAAVLNSVLVWWSVVILSGASLTSVLFTIIVLVTGAICIVLGFRLRATALRHYGLILVMVSVLKLAVLDIGSQNSMVRVLSLAVGGAVCFALSLAYNKAVAEDERARPDRAPAGAATGPQQPQGVPTGHAAGGTGAAGAVDAQRAEPPSQRRPPTSPGGYGLTPPT